MKKRRIWWAAALLLAAGVYWGYIRIVPNPAKEFLHSDTLTDQSVWLRVDTLESIRESEVLDEGQRAALAAVLRETEVRRYALWEPWDTSGNSSVFVTFYFHDGTKSTRLTLCPPGRYIRFDGEERRYYVPEAGRLYEEILRIVPLGEVYRSPYDFEK